VENRLIFTNTNPGSRRLDNLSSSPAIAPQNAPNPLTQEEIKKLREDAGIDNFQNSFDSNDKQENINNFEAQSKERIKDFEPLLMAMNQSKIGPRYKDWKFNSDAGLVRIYHDFKELGIDVEGPFYKSVFAILNNTIRLIDSGQLESDIFSNPIINEEKIKSIDNVANFDGELFLKAVNFIIDVQRELLKNDVSEELASEKSYGDKKMDWAGGALGDVVSGFKTAVAKRDWASLMLYGGIGFLGYKGIKHMMSKTSGKWAVYGTAVGALFYLSGNGAKLEKYIGDAVRSTTGYEGSLTPGEGLLKLIDLAGGDEQTKKLLMDLGITEDHLRQIMGSTPNSLDNLGIVVNGSAEPEASEIKSKGIDNNVLLKIKDVNLKDLYSLSMQSDAVETPSPKFISPKHPVVKKFFPEFASTAIPKSGYFHNIKDLQEFENQSNVFKQGFGVNASLGNYVETGRMIYNLVRAMRIGYNDKFPANNSKFLNVSFEEAINKDEYQNASVMNFLNALRTYTEIDNKRYMEKFLEVIKGFTGGKMSDKMDLKIIKINTVTSIYTVNVFGMPMRAYKDPSTDEVYLYLYKDLPSDNQVPTSSIPAFMVVPRDLEDHIFTRKFGEIVDGNKAEILNILPKEEITINGEKFEHKDLDFGEFRREHGKWSQEVIVKDPDTGERIGVYLLDIGFDTSSKPVVEAFEILSYLNSRIEFNRIRPYETLTDHEKISNLKGTISSIEYLLKPRISDYPVISSEVEYDKDEKTYSFSLNGIPVKAVFDPDNLDYVIYNANGFVSKDLSSVFIKIPLGIRKDGDLREVFKPLYENPLNTAIDSYLSSNTLNASEVKISDAIFRQSEKKWIVEVHKNEDSSLIQEFWISFDENEAVAVEKKDPSIRSRRQGVASGGAPSGGAVVAPSSNPTISTVNNPLDAPQDIDDNTFERSVNDFKSKKQFKDS
jgi:hypothetical protein